MNDYSEQFKELVFLDTETTGGDPEDRVCQVAYIYQGVEYDELFKPPLPIKPDASAVNHIDNHMVADKGDFAGSDMQAHLQQLLQEDKQILIAHNAKFDITMLQKDDVETVRFIDTLKVARHMDPEGKLPKYGMQYLRYKMDLRVENAPAHNALGDIRVLVKLFERLYQKHIDSGLSHEEVIADFERVSQLPSLIKKFNFGKHIGKAVADVANEDRGYLEWLLKQKQTQRSEGNPDEDWEFTLDTYLN